MSESSLPSQLQDMYCPPHRGHLLDSAAKDVNLPDRYSAVPARRGPVVERAGLTATHRAARVMGLTGRTAADVARHLEDIDTIETLGPVGDELVLEALEDDCVPRSRRTVFSVLVIRHGRPVAAHGRSQW